MTGFTTQQLLEHAEENVKALRLAVRQHAFKDSRAAIETDLRYAEAILAYLQSSQQLVAEQSFGWVDGDELVRLHQYGTCEIYAFDKNKGYDARRQIPVYLGPQPAQEPAPATCKYCGGSGYFRWQESYNQLPCPCKGCTQPKGNL